MRRVVWTLDVTTDLAFSAGPSACYDVAAAGEWPVFFYCPGICAKSANPKAGDTLRFVSREKCEQPVVVGGYADDAWRSIGSGSMGDWVWGYDQELF